MDPLTPQLQVLEEKVKALMPMLTNQVAATAKYFINENFEKQGFQGEVFDAWDKRKHDIDPGRPILVGKGTSHLKRSPHETIEGTKITITSNEPYSQIHNEGGVINHPAHETILNFDKTPENARWRFGKVRTISQQRGIKAIRRAHVGAYTITMPKRQFMGPSPVLDKRVIALIDKALSNLNNH
jgi:phage gpG-like protein